VGAVATWTDVDPTHRFAPLAFAAAVLIVELGAWALAQDETWARPAHGLAMVAEVLAAAPVVAAGLVVIGSGAIAASSAPDPQIACAFGVLGVAAVIAGGRRGGWAPATVAAALTAVAAVTMGFADAGVSAVAMVVTVGAVLVWGAPDRRPSPACASSLPSSPAVPMCRGWPATSAWPRPQ